MNESQEKVLKYLIGYDALAGVPVETLEKLVDENPYFPVAQFLLAQKLKIEKKDNYQSQVQKTALFFSNPYWLDYQLNGEPVFTASAIINRDEVLNKNLNTALQAPVQINADHSITDSFLTDELVAASELAHQTLQEDTEPENAIAITAEADNLSGWRNVNRNEDSGFLQNEDTMETPVIIGVSEEQALPFSDQLDQNFEKIIHPNIEKTLAGEPASAILTGEIKPSALTQAPEFSTEYKADIINESISQQEEETAAITRDIDAPTEQFISTLNPGVAATISDNVLEPTTDITTATMETETVVVAEEMAGVTHTTNTETEAFLQEVEPLKDEQSDKVEEAYEPDDTDGPEDYALNTVSSNNLDKDGNDEHERMFLNIKAMLDASSEEANAETKEAYVPIDPYYTIDYFASQGIKLELDNNPNDQLGRNLKKFTQWLKHMKKLGPEDALEAITNTETEADIQLIADSSNTIKEVVTEAMALVLEKQGKKGKAIELYNKLSFLNTDKSTYFADKIKNLKGI